MSAIRWRPPSWSITSTRRTESTAASTLIWRGCSMLCSSSSPITAKMSSLLSYDRPVRAMRRASFSLATPGATMSMSTLFAPRAAETRSKNGCQCVFSMRLSGMDASVLERSGRPSRARFLPGSALSELAEAPPDDDRPGGDEAGRRGERRVGHRPGIVVGGASPVDEREGENDERRDADQRAEDEVAQPDVRSTGY